MYVFSLISKIQGRFMYKLILFLLFGCAALGGEIPKIEIPATGMLTNLEGEPSGVIEGVNVITGEFTDSEIDLSLPGPEPLTLGHTLRNNNPHPVGSTRQIGWQMSDDESVMVNNTIEASHDYSGEYRGGDGEYLYFILRRKHGGHHALAPFEKSILRYGFTNTSRGVIGAITNVKNSFMEWSKPSKTCNITKSDGTFLHFASQRKGENKDRYLLIDEIRPNYRKYYYDYSENFSGGQLDKKILRNYAGKALSYYTWSHGRHHHICTGCDGRQVTYRYHFVPIRGRSGGHYSCLTHVERSHAPTLVYDYLPGKDHIFDEKPANDPNHIPDIREYPKLVRKSYPEFRFIMLSYYQVGVNHIDGRAFQLDLASPLICKVHALYAPLGSDTSPVAKYQFDYYLPQGIGGGGCTGVYDAKGNLTNYTYNDRKRLTAIIKYAPQKLPYTVENLHWGQEDTPHEIELQARTFGLSKESGKTFCKLFHYSERGDILEEKLYGNLTGKERAPLLIDGKGRPLDPNSEHLLKSYAYSNDNYNLLLKRKIGAIEERFAYIPRTNLLAASYRSSQKGTFLRHFYDYNDMGVVIRTIIDDGCGEERDDLSGITERKIETIERSLIYPCGLPLAVTEHYIDLETGEEKLHYKKKNRFDSLGRLLRQETYGSDELLASSEEWSYDLHGNCVKHIDPLGHVTQYFYDANDNPICEDREGFIKHFTYDFMNRLIETKELHPDGILSTKIHYDLIGNPVSTVDTFGNETMITYDPFNRPVEIALPAVKDLSGRFYRPKTFYTYDEMSRPIQMTDPEGNITEFKYTLYGKPYFIRYPDGSEEYFEYDLEGRLTKEIAKNGTITHYILDDLGRTIKKQIFSKEGELLIETEAGYSSSHLLYEKDAAGILTYYTYDALGRKKSVQKGEHLTTYQYDPLDRIASITEGGVKKSYIYDALNQVTGEKVESEGGELLTETFYSYDKEGRRTKIEERKGDIFTSRETLFDTHGIPRVSIDANGNKIHSRLILDYINENGQKVASLETIDSLGQITIQIQDAQGRTVQVEKKDPFGNPIQKTTYAFNGSGKLLQTTHTLLDGNEKTVAWEYDSLHRPTLFIEGKGTEKEKKTQTVYNAVGQKASIIKPSGVSLFYSYDPLGRLSELSSSDRTLHYRYHYDLLSNPYLVEDLIFNTATEKEYSMHGEVLKEILGNGLSIRSIYSNEGHLTSLTLPDNTSIDYSYQGNRLEKVERKEVDGKTRYLHSYRYVCGGYIENSSPIFDLEPVSYRYSSKGEIESINCHYQSEQLGYDACGNLIEKSFTDTLGEVKNHYSYDPLYQLTGEEGGFSNSYTYDSLYNRLSKNGNAYQYNALGELLSDQENLYSYDPCGNLTEIQSSRGTSTFTYDALDRLIHWSQGGSSYTFRYDENNRCLLFQEGDRQKRILYAGQNDIGTFDEEGNALNLRILGKGVGAEIGATVAIEIGEMIYAPFHDSRGNITALIDKRGNSFETYRYSAFGEEKIFRAGEPATSSLNPWRFSSKRTILGYSLFGRRFYLPSLGRWLTPDPIGYEGGPNLYAYVSNNPLTHFDLYGLIEEGRSSFWQQAKGYISRALESFREGAKRAYERTRDIFHKAGGYFKELTRDVIPLPVIKDVGCMIGHFFEHGTLRGYTPSWSGFHSKYIQNEQKPPLRAHITLGFINGVKTSRQDSVEGADHISEVFGEVRVDQLYVADHGLSQNCLGVILGKCGITTCAVEKAVQGIRDMIRQVGGVGSDGLVLLIAFSQGGQVLSNAIDKLSKEESSMLGVATFGTAKIILDQGTRFAVNYIAKNDYIPAISDTALYLRAKAGLVPNVHFVDPVESDWFGHRFKSETYTEALKDYKDHLFQIGIL